MRQAGFVWGGAMRYRGARTHVTVSSVPLPIRPHFSSTFRNSRENASVPFPSLKVNSPKVAKLAKER
jgi:hypothetical protein